MGAVTLAIQPNEDVLTSKCYPNIVAPTRGSLPTIGFEFDLNYGASTESPPRPYGDARFTDTIQALNGTNLTTHRMKADRFRVEGDFNRIEIATKPFELSSAGRQEMRQVIEKVLELVVDLESRCKAARPATSLRYPAAAGTPRFFAPPYLERAVACVFPLSFNPRKEPYFASACVVGASPQATLQVPLASIDAFVAAIQASENAWVAGRALSGPKGKRQGVRSLALYQAKDAVNQSRNAHLKADTRLPDGTAVNEKNFSPTLQGLLILMVSYLRSGELQYGSKDYEDYAKSYLPLNVKNPFRLLFADLTADERRVFTELYDSPRRKLWQLAKPGASDTDGSTRLFPARAHGHQACWFADVPTWHDFIEKTVSNKPLIRNDYCTGKNKAGEDIGCEVLFAPFSRILPYETGSRRVTVEMRRLGHNWVFSQPFTADGVHHPGWGEMTETLFDLAMLVNR
jgi:hypothetical protein